MPTPPRLANRLVAARVRSARQAEVLDDLHDLFLLDCEHLGVWRAQLLYWFNTLNILLFGIGEADTAYSYHTAGPFVMYKNYLKIALRTIRKHKGYAFINITGLAVGIACCLLIVLFIQNELSYDHFHEHADRIYRVNNEVYLLPDTPSHWGVGPAIMGPTLKATFPEVEAVTRYERMGTQRVQYGDTPLYEDRFRFVDSTFLDIFSFPLVQGHAETALKEPFSLVLSHEMARKYFGGADPMGAFFRIGELANEQIYRVTGVLAPLPANTRFDVDFLASYTSYEATVDPRRFTTWRSLGTETYVLVGENQEGDALNAKLPGFIKQYIEGRGSYIPYLQPLTDIHLNRLELGIQAESDIRYLYIFGAIALFILVIACINYMNLATARAVRRAKEVAVRKMVGAYRLQLVKQFLSESLLLSVLGFVGALLLLQAVLPVFNNLLDQSLALHLDSSLTVWLMLLGLSVLVGVLAGSYPALFLSGYTPISMLRGASEASRGPARLRHVLVTVQFGMSMVLLIATTVIYNQLDYVRTKNLGFDQEHLVVVNLRDPAVRAKYATFKQQALAHPNVLSVTAASVFPSLHPGTNGIRPEGFEKALVQAVYAVDPDYLATLQIPLVAGRSFSDAFRTDSAAFVINEAALATYGWTPEDALGKQLERNGRPGTIIGVVPDFHFTSLHRVIEPLVLAYSPTEFSEVGLRIRGENIRETLNFLAATWSTLAPDLPFTYTFLDDKVAQLYTDEQKLGQLFGLFAGLAILIACLGLFGLASFMAEQRTKEIGIRKVLGATLYSIVLLLTKDFSKLVVLAFILASPIAYLIMEQWLADFAYRTHIGLMTFVIAGVAALAIAWLTVSYQSIRAALGNPIDALRYE